MLTKHLRLKDGSTLRHLTGDNRKVILAKNGNSNCTLDERQFAFAASSDEGLRFVYYGANDVSQWRAFEAGTILAKHLATCCSNLRWLN